MRRLLPVALVATLAAGCFNEPEPAYKSVPAENRVYLSGKGLTDLSKVGDAFAAGAAIDYLNLDRNKLASVEGVETLTKLKWLRLNDNKLESVPDLSHLARLEKIYLAGNRLREVPPFLEALPELEMIDMSGNPVAEIPEWLARKSGLRHLDLSRTALRSLPADLGAWKSLRSLKLGDLRLDEGEMRRIRSALPGVRIVF